MDFGLDGIIDDDIGYRPTIKKEEKTRARPTSLSRQSSIHSISSLNDVKEDEAKPFRGNGKENETSIGLVKESPKSSLFNIDNYNSREMITRKSTLLGVQKEASSISNPSKNFQEPLTFEEFFRSQSSSNTPSFSKQLDSKPLLSELKPPLPEKRIEKNASKDELITPENIIEDEVNDLSMVSRRGKPPLNKRNQIGADIELQQNRLESVLSSKNANNNSTELPILIGPSSGLKASSTLKENYETVIPSKIKQSSSGPSLTVHQGPAQLFTDETMEELKKVFSNQLEYQKQGFESLIKELRANHLQELKQLKDFYEEEIRKKLEIKEFELEKAKEFYELQLKIFKERQQEVKEYNVISKKLEGNIKTIENLEKSIKENSFKNQKEREDEIKILLQKKESDLKIKEDQLHAETQELETLKIELKKEKSSLLEEINSEKTRIYQLELDLRKKESELTFKYKKLEISLVSDFEQKSKQLDQQKEELRMELINLNEQRNLIEIGKQEVINARKLWDNEKKSFLEQIHEQRTKVLEKEIEIASRSGQIELKEQEVQIHQSDYINKLKLIELERIKINIEKSNAKGQLYLNVISGTVKNHGLFGTGLMNRTSDPVLQTEHYSNGNFEKDSFQLETNFKKSITQMRDEFLKSIPKF